MGPATNHDAAIAAIETAFTEFEEEKADIYEMGKIAKVSSLTTDMFITLETPFTSVFNYDNVNEPAFKYNTVLKEGSLQ